MKQRFALIGLYAAGAILLGACARPAAESKTEAPAPAAESAAGRQTVKLNAEEIQKMGIAVTSAEAAQFQAQTEGYGVVLSHETLAQAVSDVTAAQAAARQSQAALARSRRLAGTAGADTTEAQDIVLRQATTDQAGMQLAIRKLSSLLGQRLPWTDAEKTRILDDIASGRRKVLKATFPLGAELGAAPQSLRVARLDAVRAEQQWSARPVWPAPSDQNIPGRSFFALLPELDVGEGERVAIWGESGPPTAGAWIPATAAVISEGRYWIYVEKSAGEYTRVALNISHPLRDGYLVASDVKPGDRVVAAGAGLLLAREMNPSSAAE